MESFLQLVFQESEKHRISFERHVFAELPGYHPIWDTYVFEGIHLRENLGYSESRLRRLIFRRALRLSDIATHEGVRSSIDHVETQTRRMTSISNRLIRRQQPLLLSS